MGATMRAITGPVLVLFVASLALAQSSAPESGTNQNLPAVRPPAISQPAPPQQQSTRDEQGTGKSPLKVRVISIPESKPESPEARRQRENHEANERGLTQYTLLLVIVTGLLFSAAAFQVGLFWSQLRLMRDGMKDTADTATAARIAAEAARSHAITAEKTFIAIHRPWVGIDHTSPWKLQPGRPKVTVTIKNSGSGPALKLRGTMQGGLAPIVPPAPTDMHPDAPPSVLLPNGEMLYHPFGESVVLTQEHVDLVQQDKLILGFTGRIEYEDATGKLHHTSLRMMYIHDSEGWQPCPGGNEAT